MQSPARVDDVIATSLIQFRADRRRDFKRENDILQDLALRLADSDRKLLDRLVQAAVTICEAGSAGLSLHGTSADGEPLLKWEAVAGEYSKYLGGTLPLYSPCGVCLERGRPELFDRPERAFPYFADVRPEIAEALVIPLRADGRDFGTIWIASHDDGRPFTDADLSFMTTLANFTAAALTLMARESAAREAAHRERFERERAERANRLKDEFLSTISHELRTPLHAILSWSELLVDGLAPADTHDAVASIHRNAQRQVQLVDDLLDSSRYLAGGMRLEMRPVDVRELLTAAGDGTRPIMDRKGLVLRLDAAPGSSWVLGDAARLQQAIGNVIANAVKFSEPGGRVSISLQPQAGHVTLQVTDEGIGIAEEFLPSVFERFSQADSSSRRRQGGLGLGLAIARDILREHGGELAASSEGLGCGATFTLTMPAAVTQGSAADVARAEHLPRLDNKTVLVVDDETDTREALAMVLRHRGAIVHTAGSAEDARRVLAQHRLDAVVTDIAMPEDDGYALLQSIRNHEDRAVRAVPVLAVTAYSSEGEQTTMIAAGFDGYVGKPIPGRELVRIVSRLVADSSR